MRGNAAPEPDNLERFGRRVRGQRAQPLGNGMDNVRSFAGYVAFPGIAERSLDRQGVFEG